jgi:DNA-binding LacI/PurR family transcriptional regulator/signal transduction histidine kinase
MIIKHKDPNNSNLHRPTIGVFVDHMTTYDLEIWSGIAEVAREQNANVIAFMGRRIGDPDRIIAQNNAIFGLAGPQNIDGLILFSAAITTYLTPQEVTAFCRRYHALPQVSAGLAVENVPSIIIDNRQGLQDLLVHLIRDHGYRHIAFITGPDTHPDALERFEVYQKVLAQYGLPFNPELVAPGDFRIESGGRAMQTLLDKTHLKIDAVLAANDPMAISAMWVLQERGIEIPEMIALAGFDDVEDGRYSIPPLSTVRQPFARLGRLAAEMVLAQLQGETTPLLVTLPTQAVIRQSCGCLSPIVRQIEAQPIVPLQSHNPTFQEFQLSSIQRETIVAEIEQALSNSSMIDAHFPIALKQLLNSFFDDIQRETADVFLPALSQVLRQTILTEKDITLWQEVLSTMRHHLLPHLAGGPLLFKAENVWYQAQVLLGEMLGQVEAYRWLKARRQTRVLAQTSQRLITTFNIEELMDVIATMLPRLGIKSGYLCLYEPPLTVPGQAPAKAKMLLAFNDTRRFKLKPEGIRFRSQLLTPVGNFLPNRQYALLVMSLYFKDKQLGFVLLELGPSETLIYQTLREQISSALQGALLVQQVQNQVLQLELTNTELQTAQERLIQQEKLAVLGQLAGGVAHEVRNPLGVIANAIYFLQLTSPDADATTKEYLDLIAGRVAETERIVSALLDFSHTRLPVKETVEVGRLVADVLAQNPPPRQVQVATNIAPDLPPVYVDASQIGQQVLANLITNAYQAMPNGGQLTITAQADASGVKLSVADTGVGMSPETQAKIFEPLFTTKAKGIGLGLAVSKNLVELNSGRIEVESIEGQGSTFTIALPATDEHLSENSV